MTHRMNRKFKHTFRSALRTVRLHGHVRIEMIQCAVCLFAALPSTLVHSLNLLVAAPWSLVLLCARNWNERVDGTHGVSSLMTSQRHARLVVKGMEAYRTRHLSDHTRGTSGTTHGHVSIDWRRAVMTRPVRPRRVHWRAWLTWVLWHLMLRRVWGILLVGRVGRARGRNGGV